MSAILLTTDLACLSAVTGTAKMHGLVVDAAMSLAALLEKAAGRRLVLLDLASPGVDPAQLVPRLRSMHANIAIVAFGPHVHEARLLAAREAGCDEVVTRGQFHRQLAEILRRYLAEPEA
jgi:CheY-like chemotaxis protein